MWNFNLAVPPPPPPPPPPHTHTHTHTLTPPNKQLMKMWSGLTLISTRISNYVHHKVWDYISYSPHSISSPKMSEGPFCLGLNVLIHLFPSQLLYQRPGIKITQTVPGYKLLLIQDNPRHCRHRHYAVQYYTIFHTAPIKEATKVTLWIHCLCFLQYRSNTCAL